MDEKHDIDDFFTEHLLTHPPTDEKQVGDRTIIQHIVSMPVNSPKQQFICLSSIFNYHWLPYPESQGSSHQLINPKSHVGYNRQLLHKPSGSHTTPTSPRNRLMYYLTMEDSFVPSLLVKRYLMIDQDEIKIDSDLTIETRNTCKATKEAETPKSNCFSHIKRHQSTYRRRFEFPFEFY